MTVSIGTGSGLDVVRERDRDHVVYYPVEYTLYFVWGFHTAVAYSSCGLTSVLYAISLTPAFLVFMFLWMKPKVILALPVALSIWEL